MSTRTLAAWCPDWPIAATGVDGAVVAAAVVHANRVVACSAAARAVGVRRNQRRREAQSQCSELEVLPLDPDGEARAYESVVAALDDTCPRVEVVRPGLCAFATRGPSRFFGGDEPLAARVADVVATAAGSPCQVGVAGGPFAAALAARTRGGLVVPAGETPAFLAPFPVAALARPELADLLRRLGIRTLGDFTALPAERVLARFGTDGALAHRLARGDDTRPLAARQPPADFGIVLELDPPAETLDAAAFAAKTLADRVHAELRSRGLACTRLAISAETEHGEQMERLWRHDGTLTPAAIAERVRWQIDGWLTGPLAARPSSGITVLRLQPDEVHPDHGRQQGFWGGATAADERAAGALARVQRLVGLDGVLTAVLTGGRSPAEQVRLVPWGDSRVTDRGDVAGSESATWPGSVPPPAPAIVHEPPVPAIVVDGGGEPVAVTGRVTCTEAPARVAIDGGSWSDVRWWAGPWPVDEKWWDPPVHRRRARFQVVTTAGTAYLLAVEGGRWWLEATYD